MQIRRSVKVPFSTRAAASIMIVCLAMRCISALVPGWRVGAALGDVVREVVAAEDGLPIEIAVPDNSVASTALPLN